MRSKVSNTGPSPPDVTAPTRHPDEDEVERLHSRHNLYRVIISRDRAGLYRVRRERWAIEDWDVGRAAFWCSDDPQTTITDSLASARHLAREKLAGTSDGMDEDVQQGAAADEVREGTRRGPRS
jgi:arylamine N-acetyltransferase